MIEKFCEVTGYGIRAVETKIQRGVWVQGREWVKAPDGHRMISMAGFQRWVEQGHKEAA
jgi:hypothetical protein